MAWTERYVRADAAGGGDGTTDANSGANGAWTLAEGITNAAAGQRINVKAGTYANTTTGRTFANSGTATQPIWWRGFTTTAGDLDAKPTSNRTVSTDMPHLTWTTGTASITGSNQIFSAISFLVTGAVAAACVRVATGGLVELHRCRMEHQNANASSWGLRHSAGPCLVDSCFIKSTSSAHVISQEASRLSVIGSILSGGLNGLDCSTGGPNAVCNVFDSQSGSAINHAVTNVDGLIVGNTIYNPSGHGIAIVSGLSAAVRIEIINNLFHTITTASKYGIYNAGASAINNVYRRNNSFYNVTTPEQQFGDTYDWDRVTEISDPLTNPGSDDFTLKTSALSFQAGLPGLFEGLTVASYASPGALIPDEVGGSSSARGSLLRGLVG